MSANQSGGPTVCRICNQEVPIIAHRLHEQKHMEQTINRWKKKFEKYLMDKHRLPVDSKHLFAGQKCHFCSRCEYPCIEAEATNGDHHCQLDTFFPLHAFELCREEIKNRVDALLPNDPQQHQPREEHRRLQQPTEAERAQLLALLAAPTFSISGGDGRSDPPATKHGARPVLGYSHRNSSPISAITELTEKVKESSSPEMQQRQREDVGLGWYRLGRCLSGGIDGETINVLGKLCTERDCYSLALEHLNLDSKFHQALVWCGVAATFQQGSSGTWKPSSEHTDVFTPWECACKAVDLVQNEDKEGNPEEHGVAIAEIWYLLGFHFDTTGPCQAASALGITSARDCFLHALKLDEGCAPAWETLGASLVDEFEAVEVSLLNRQGMKHVVELRQRECFQFAFSHLDPEVLAARPKWLSRWYYNLGVSLVSAHPKWETLSSSSTPTTTPPILRHVESQKASFMPKNSPHGSKCRHLEKLDCYKEAVEHDPRNYRAWYALGYASAAGKEFTVNVPEEDTFDRLTCYTMAIFIYPEYAPAWNNAGLSADKGTEKAFVRIQGRKYTSQRCYLKALECDPEYKDAYVNLGGTLREDQTIEVTLRDGKGRVRKDLLTQEECFVRGGEWNNVGVCRWNQITRNRRAREAEKNEAPTAGGGSALGDEANEEGEAQVLEYFTRAVKPKAGSFSVKVKNWGNYAQFLNYKLRSLGEGQDGETTDPLLPESTLALRADAVKRLDQLETYYHEHQPRYHVVETDRLMNRATLGPKLKKAVHGGDQWFKITNTARYYHFVDESLGYKEYKEECRLLVQDELQVMKRLRHENIVPTLSLVQDPDNRNILGFTFPSMEQGNLETNLDNAQPSTIANWITCVASALSYAHSQGMVHGHLNITSVRIKDNHVKLSHFGSPKMQHILEWQLSRDRHWGPNCVDSFPPDFRNSTTFTQEMEVYTFGLLLKKLWDFGLFVKIKKEEHLCFRCCAHDPADRPTMQEVLSVLRNELIDCDKVSPLANHTGIWTVRGRFNKGLWFLLKEAQFTPKRGSDRYEASNADKLLRMKHPNLIFVEDVEVNPKCGHLQVLMELGNGDARDFFTAHCEKFQEDPNLFEVFLKRFIHHVLKALNHMHMEMERGSRMIHGDIKPENVIYCFHDNNAATRAASSSSQQQHVDPHSSGSRRSSSEAGFVGGPSSDEEEPERKAPVPMVDFKLADFGAVRPISHSTLPRTGSHTFFAPECCHQTQTHYADPLHDIWALGVSVITLHNILAGDFGQQLPSGMPSTASSDYGEWKSWMVDHILKTEAKGQDPCQHIFPAMPQNMSSECQTFLRRIFIQNPKRATAMELLRDVYLNEEDSAISGR